MTDIGHVCDLLQRLDGLNGLREYLDSVVREELEDLLFEPLQALMAELDAEDDALPEDDRRQLARLKGLLNEVVTAGQDALELMSSAATDAVREPVRKAQKALGELEAWIGKREASMPRPDHAS